MNVKRFTARSSRDALTLVRQALGDDAVVLSTKPCAEGVEMLAMAPEGMAQIERMAAPAGVAPAKPVPEVQKDVEQLSMSTLSFQDYVRERMLRRRQAAMKAEAVESAPQRGDAEMSPLQARLTARMGAPGRAQDEARSAPHDGASMSAPAAAPAIPRQPPCCARNCASPPSPTSTCPRWPTHRPNCRAASAASTTLPRHAANTT
jgi:flagellar biosynthesis protein FlhF